MLKKPISDLCGFESIWKWVNVQRSKEGFF
jgi:hypothetical protein